MDTWLIINRILFFAGIFFAILGVVLFWLTYGRKLAEKLKRKRKPKKAAYTRTSAAKQEDPEEPATEERKQIGAKPEKKIHRKKREPSREETDEAADTSLLAGSPQDDDDPVTGLIQDEALPMPAAFTDEDEDEDEPLDETIGARTEDLAQENGEQAEAPKHFHVKRKIVLKAYEEDVT